MIVDELKHGFLNQNQRQERLAHDAGGVKGGQKFWEEVARVIKDLDWDENISENSFPEDERIVDAFNNGLDLGDYIKDSDWSALKKLCKKQFDDYDKACLNMTKSGNHASNMFGNRYTTDIAVYYYHLFILANPGFHKAVAVTLDDTILNGATGGKRSAKKASGSKTKRKAKTSEFAEAFGNAFAPLVATQQKSAAAREKRDTIKELGRLSTEQDNLFKEMIKYDEGTEERKYYGGRIEEVRNLRRTLQEASLGVSMHQPQVSAKKQKVVKKKKPETVEVLDSSDSSEED